MRARQNHSAAQGRRTKVTLKPEIPAPPLSHSLTPSLTLPPCPSLLCLCNPLATVSNRAWQLGLCGSENRPQNSFIDAARTQNLQRHRVAPLGGTRQCPMSSGRRRISERCAETAELYIIITASRCSNDSTYSIPCSSRKPRTIP